MGKEWAGLFFPRGKNGPAHSFPGEKTDWGEIPACYTGLRSAVGNVSGYRCVSDCRSRGREFDPGPVPDDDTFVEIGHEIISTVILLPSADLFKKGCCQLQAKVCAQITG